MWLLKKLNDGTTKYLICEKKFYTVGRKNCDFTFEDDASVSRKHCTIHVAKKSECPFAVNTISGVWLVDAQSKYGTYLMDKNDWIKINAGENKRLTSGSVIKFGLMGNIWCLEFKPVVACASGIPVEQKKNIESTLQLIDGFLRNAWCKECSLVIVNEITLTVKVVLALINGVPIVTPNYVQKLVESVKNQTAPPSYEDYRPVIKESILDKSLVLLDSKNHRKELFKGIKFVIPTKRQLDTLKEVITSAGGNCELLSPGGKLERFAEDNVVVIQLPINNVGIPEDLCKLFKEITTLLKNKFGRRVVPESEIAQAVAYSSTEKFCNPRSTCFNLKIGEQKKVDLGPVIVEETPAAADDTKHSGFGVVPSSETVESEDHFNAAIPSPSPLNKGIESQRCVRNAQKVSERKRTHSPNQGDDGEFQQKKSRSISISKAGDTQGSNLPSREKDNLQSKSSVEEKSNLSKINQNKPSYITIYFQKQNKGSEDNNPQLMRQNSSNFWDISSSSKSPKRKISTDADGFSDNSCSSRKKPKLPDANVCGRSTPERYIDTPREVVEVLERNINSGDSFTVSSSKRVDAEERMKPRNVSKVSVVNENSRDAFVVPAIRNFVTEEDDDRTGYFGKDVTDAIESQLDELNNTIFSLTIISPAFIKEDGSLIDPPSVPVNVKRFKKQKILSSAFFESLAEQDDDLSEGEWIEPHSDRVNISAVEGFD